MNKFSTSKAEKLALLLVILFGITIVISFVPKAYLLVAPGLDATAFTVQTKLSGVIYSILSFVVYIGCAIWLYYESNENGKTKWVWVALGLFTGALALILWYLKKIHEKLSNQTT